MESILSDLQAHPQAWPFKEPVNAQEVPNYYDVIQNPMGQSYLIFLSHSGRSRQLFRADFSTMEHKLEAGQYQDLDAFIADAQLVFDNAQVYNPEDIIYYKGAVKMERVLMDHVSRVREIS